MYAKSHVALGKVNVSCIASKYFKNKSLEKPCTLTRSIGPFSLTKNRLSTRLHHHRSVLRVVKTLACPVVMAPRTYSSQLYRINCINRFIRMAATAATKGPTRVHRIKLKRSLDTVLVIGPVATKNKTTKDKLWTRHRGRTK